MAYCSAWQQRARAKRHYIWLTAVLLTKQRRVFRQPRANPRLLRNATITIRQSTNRRGASDNNVAYCCISP